jgi:hypothetical protein
MTTFLLGAVAMASVVAAMFFLRFWRQTDDRFFLLFAIAFALDAATRALIALEIPTEQEPTVYLGRLVTFGLILVAIVGKNFEGEK